MTKKNSTIGNDALMVSALSLLMTGTAKATEIPNCVVPLTCSSLGYTQTLEQCNGKFYLKCPFGDSYYCGGSSCSDGQPYLPDKDRCAICEDYGMVYDPDRAYVTCKKTNVAISGTKLTCYDDCTPCPKGYAPSSNECVAMGTTCADYGHYGADEKPSNLDCTSVSIDLGGGNVISCYNANDCKIINSGGGSTTTVLTEAQCKAKYPPKSCFLNVGTLYTSSDMSAHPECLKYGFLKECAQWTVSDCPGGSC